jgi:hypothetical protein
VGTSTCHDPMGVHGLLQGELHFTFASTDGPEIAWKAKRVAVVLPVEMRCWNVDNYIAILSVSFRLINVLVAWSPAHAPFY